MMHGYNGFLVGALHALFSSSLSFCITDTSLLNGDSVAC